MDNRIYLPTALSNKSVDFRVEKVVRRADGSWSSPETTTIHLKSPGLAGGVFVILWGKHAVAIAEYVSAEFAAAMEE